MFARVIVLVGAAMVLLFGCSILEDETLAPAPLVTITTRRADCSEGRCLHILVIERDGRVHQREPSVANLGTIPAEQLRGLDAAIRATDFGAMRLRRAKEDCPATGARDELIYEFGTPAGIERVSSCETEFDPQHPAFAAVRDGLIAGNAFPRP
jgi:hypothetical protein